MLDLLTLSFFGLTLKKMLFPSKEAAEQQLYVPALVRGSSEETPPVQHPMEAEMQPPGAPCVAVAQRTSTTLTSAGKVAQ